MHFTFRTLLLAATLLFVCRAAAQTPTIIVLQPENITVGMPGFTLEVAGVGFESRAVVRWNGADRPTTYRASTSLRAAISSADLINAGEIAITVFNPTDRRVSQPARFTVMPNPLPVLDAQSVSRVFAGTEILDIQVGGGGFVP